MACRAAYLDRIRGTGVVLSGSSAQSALPPTYVADQLRSKAWRSKVGYNVVAGFNDRVPFDATSASLTPGNYSTPALYAAHVQASLLAAGLTGATCTYDSSTHRFTLAATGPFTLPWLTGTDTDRSAGKDLGFDTSADDSSASSHEADSVSYHSREWLQADLGSAMAAQLVVCVDHNFSVSSTVTALMHGSDSWDAPSVSQALTVGDELALSYLSASETYQYHRLLVEDVANPDGYSEVGVWCVAPYTQPGVMYTQGWPFSPDDLSTVAFSHEGAHFQDIGQQRGAWPPLEWHDLTASDRDALMAIWEARGVGGDFFFTFDTDDPLDTTFYVFISQPPQRPHSVGDYWHVSLSLAEALG